MLWLLSKKRGLKLNSLNHNWNELEVDFRISLVDFEASCGFTLKSEYPTLNLNLSLSAAAQFELSKTQLCSPLI